jgi:hypothetical protein
VATKYPFSSKTPATPSKGAISRRLKESAPQSPVMVKEKEEATQSPVGEEGYNRPSVKDMLDKIPAKQSPAISKETIAKRVKRGG